MDLNNSVLDPVFLKSSLTFARLGELISVQKYLKARCKEGVSLFSLASLDGFGISWRDKWKWAQIKTWNSVWTEVNGFYCGSGQTLEQVAKRSCGVSLEILRRHLDVVFGTRLLSALLVQRFWTRGPPEIPSNLNHSVKPLSKGHLLPGIKQEQLFHGVILPKMCKVIYASPLHFKRKEQSHTWLVLKEEVCPIFAIA